MLLTLLKTLQTEDYRDGLGKVIPFLQADLNKKHCCIVDTEDLITELEQLQSEGKILLRHMFEGQANPGPISTIKLLVN